MPDDFNIAITVQDAMTVSVVKQDEINVAVSTPLILGLVATPVLSAIDLPTSKVTITCATDGATIYYTIDGSVPTEDDTEYTVPIYVSETTTIRANAFKTSYTTSNVGSETYTITNFFVNDQSSLDTTTFTITGTNGKTVYMNHGDGNITTINMDGAGHNYDIDYGVGNEGSYNVSFSGDLDEVTDFRCYEPSVSGDGEWVGNQMPILSFINFAGSNTSGNINVFASTTTLTQIRFISTSWSGDFADLAGLINLTFSSIESSGINTYTQGILPSQWDGNTLFVQQVGWSQQEVDDFLGDLDTSSVSVTNKTLNIGGNNSAPSATGKEAILSLVQKGRTVIASTLQEHGIVTQADIQQSLADGVAFLNLETLGSTLWDSDASTFVGTSTYSWVPQSGNTIANVNNELEITHIDQEYGAYIQLRDSHDLNSDLTIGEIYRLDVDAYYSGGSSGVKLHLVTDSPVYSPELTNVKTTYTFYFIATSATGNNLKLKSLGASNKVYIDNLSIQLVSNSLIPYAGADSGDTPYFVELKNQAGEDFINGFIGAQGGGETFGTSLWDADAAVFVSGTYSWNAVPNNTIANVGNELQITYGGSQRGASVVFRNASDLTADLVLDTLYQYGFDGYYIGGASGVYVDFVGEYGIAEQPVLTGSKTSYTVDLHPLTTNSMYTRLGSMKTGNLVYLGNLFIRAYTDCSANGVHIISAKDGVVQNWANKDVNYNRNDTEYAWAIYSS